MSGLVQNWPFVVLAASVLFIIISITRFKLHPFLALVMAAIFAGILSRIYPLSTAVEGMVVISSLADVLRLTMEGFGKTAAGIAISIGLASIIGFCLMESGAADRVVRRFLKIFGERNAGIALLVSTYILSIPIFFDTMFMLMAPLAKALYVRTGKNYLLYILCVCCGGVITHSLTVPHPGPIAMVDNLKIDVGFSIIGGIVAGILPAVAGYFIACALNRRIHVPLRETPGTSLADLESIIDKKDSELPGLVVSLIPVVLPILLISTSSFLKVAESSGAMPLIPSAGISDPALSGVLGDMATLREFIHFLGDKNIALFIGAFISIILLAKARNYDRVKISELLGPPLETAGIIILITSAGGAFGAMIKNAGVGGAVEKLADSMGLSLVLLSYVLALIIRVAQGSATVAMLTTSAIMFPMIGPDLPYHPIYLFLSIGFAAFSLSWMNDSGFWVVSRLSGMTEKETLKSWSVMLTLVSLVGLVVTWLGSLLIPLV
jgi:gluconate:H+ symporter, GntP family